MSEPLGRPPTTAASRRAVEWRDGVVEIIDQTALPGDFRVLRLNTCAELVDAIRRLAVRGAPALGVVGALGVARSALAHPGDETAVRGEAERIARARPTAVNLAWGVEQALRWLPDGPDAVLAAALRLLDEDGRINQAAARRAASLVLDRCTRRPLRVLTLCNTGRLATAAWGTALGTVRELHGLGVLAEVLACETRPLLQGSRLTTWELAEAGIPHRLCVDSAAAFAMARGMVDCVLVGADRVAANGDVANKIGTYALALAADRHGIPFVVVAPESTVDESLASGAEIPVEERAAAEVTTLGGMPTAPAGTAAFNPAFDVTPADLITAVVTEDRLIGPAAGPVTAGQGQRRATHP